MTQGVANSSHTPCGGHDSDRRIFALSDPHLSISGKKPMHVFGPAWDNHAERLKTAWTETVRDGDIVLVPGDISWAMRLADAVTDLEWLAALPGDKVLLRGNHDYWWQSLKKMEALAIPTLHFIQNNHIVLGDVAIGGSRMWDFPGIFWRFVSNRDNPDVAPEKRDLVKAAREEDPDKIRARELERLRLSLSGLPKDAGYFRIAMLHYPPISEDGQPTVITSLIDEFDIDLCVFGHVHALLPGNPPGADIVIGKTRYVLAASDYLGHAPLRVR
ncbi:MAG: metallophosphoesterase [Planctomycetaceae bacterium]|nr:metallophosphoesterase [Planctomycetaceae bacterium]